MYLGLHVQTLLQYDLSWLCRQYMYSTCQTARENIYVDGLEFPLREIKVCAQ